MFSKSCEYALRATIYIAQQTTKNKKVSIVNISKEINSPEAFTAKVLQQLSKNKIIKSIKGLHGGFIIEEGKMKTIVLSDIVKLFDGNSIYTGCGLGLKGCDSNAPCPLHEKFNTIRENLKNMLEKTTLEILVNEMDSNLLWLKR